MTLQEYNEKYWKGSDGNWNPGMRTILNGWKAILRWLTLPKDSDTYTDIKNFLEDWDSLTPEDQDECTEKYDIETYIKPLFEQL